MTIIKGEPCELPALLALHSLRRSELLDLERADIAEDCITVHASRVPIIKTVSFTKKRTRPAHRRGLCPLLFHGSKKYFPMRMVILSGAIATRRPSRSTDCAAQITYQKLGFTGCAGALPASRIISAGTSELQCATAWVVGLQDDERFLHQARESDLLRDATKMVEFYSGAAS